MPSVRGGVPLILGTEQIVVAVVAAAAVVVLVTATARATRW